MTNAITRAYAGKRVLVTGHTGFKGSWLSLWLELLGAEVTGFALTPPTTPAMFDLCMVESGIRHIIGDVRDTRALDAALAVANPDILLHLAAQPIVRLSYAEPVETLDVNVMGTAQVLEAVRRHTAASQKRCEIVVVTSDKCYANHEWPWGYRENDPMGGHDPYSMSKGATELVVESWRQSYFAKADSLSAIASGRAGNVIGGGDWAENRIMTDLVAAVARGEPLELRNPLATRPWQHVLEPLSGYLWLGAQLMGEHRTTFAQGWNFGPHAESICTVAQLADKCFAVWGSGSWQLANEADSPKEAQSLSLAIEKARYELHWQPVWGIDKCTAATIAWYKQWHEAKGDLRTLTLHQIRQYSADAQGAGVAWAQTAPAGAVA